MPHVIGFKKNISNWALELTPLIDSNYSTYSVIKNSQLVFVLSGFVGFEAIILKKPVIAFGDTMYG